MSSNSSFLMTEEWLNQPEVALTLKYRVKNKFEFVGVDYI